MVVQQGDLFWMNFNPSQGSEPKGLRPALVIQDDAFNRSAINTIIVVAVTSNLKYEKMPGNVRLRKGESGIPKSSIINVSQVKTVDRVFLQEKIGKLSKNRFEEVKNGLKNIFGIQ